jgi:hypothetical protein
MHIKLANTKLYVVELQPLGEVCSRDAAEGDGDADPKIVRHRASVWELHWEEDGGESTGRGCYGNVCRNREGSLEWAREEILSKVYTVCSLTSP